MARDDPVVRLEQARAGEENPVTLQFSDLDELGCALERAIMVVLKEPRQILEDLAAEIEIARLLERRASGSEPAFHVLVAPADVCEPREGTTPFVPRAGSAPISRSSTAPCLRRGACSVEAVGIGACPLEPDLSLLARCVSRSASSASSRATVALRRSTAIS